MKKKTGIFLTLLGISSAIFAQEPKPQKANREDNSSFTFTESQLNEDDDAAQGVSAFVTSNNDPYLSNVGYLFSPMRFRIRGYDSRYNNMYINGIQFNNVETGRFSYGLIGGLNDATRNKEGVNAFEPNMFGYSPIGGATNIDVRASHYGAGSKISLSGCNRNYLLRGMYTYATGLMKNGWAFTGSLSYRWANEGNIEGTFYNSLGYFFAAEKKINDKHSISFATWGSPTQRGQQGASTEEAYYLANSHYYNPYWGYQNGKKRNSRVVNSYEPSAVATWDFTIDKDTKLTTSAGFKYSNYGTSALGWNGNASDPRPDYYKKLPSSAFNVYNPNYTPSKDELSLFNQITTNWKDNKAYRQLDWDGMYFANSQANALGKEALYYLEERHNDQLAYNINSVLKHNLSKNRSYALGASLSATKGMHYKKMKDLLGANSYTDIDKFAARTYGYNSPIIQNDLSNPNQQISKGDKFGYNYNINVYKESLWAQYQQRNAKISYFAAGKIGSTQFSRDGKMKNGRAPKKSLGGSGTAKFLEGSVKLGLVYKLNGNNSFSLNAGYDNQAPVAYNAFVAPRIKNDFVKDLKTEQILNGEVNYMFNYPIISGRISGYYTRFYNQIEMYTFYSDDESRFTYLSMNGIQKEHKGIEAAATVKILSNLSLTAIGTLSDARYMNNPKAVRTYENESESTNDRVYSKGLHDDGTPLSAYSLGLDYNTNGWFFSVNGNYYDRVYVGFSTYNRLGSVLGTNSGAFDEKGNLVDEAKVPQERFDGGFVLDASIGKYIRLKGGKSLSINLNVNNILNNTNLRTGGYEQNRSDNYGDGAERVYQFSKNSKYYYAPACNAFLNIGYRF